MKYCFFVFVLIASIVRAEIIVQAIDTNRLVKITVYSDGRTITEQIEPREPVQNAVTLNESTLPARMAAIQEARRLVELAGTNTVSVAIAPGTGEPPARPIRIFSILKIKRTLDDAGLWYNVKQYLESNGLWDDFCLANNFREDDEAFVAGLTALKEMLGMSNAAVESILVQCVAE